MKRNLLKNNGVQSLLASLVCIVLGLFLGYVVLLIINPAGAGEAILTVIKNFLTPPCERPRWHPARLPPAEESAGWSRFPRRGDGTVLPVRLQWALR